MKSEIRNPKSETPVSNFGFRISDFGFRISDFGFRISDFGFKGGFTVFRALFEKFKQGLAKTRMVFTGIAQLFRLKGRVDRDFLSKLEKHLYEADVGSSTSPIVEGVRQAYLDKEITGDVEQFVKQQLKDLLQTEQVGLCLNPKGPTVILISGVNGSGKTTSIAKLASALKGKGKKVVVAACDTFRAAAVEQLTIWSERIGCEIVKGQPGSDPGKRGSRCLREGSGPRSGRAHRRYRRAAAHPRRT